MLAVTISFKWNAVRTFSGSRMHFDRSLVSRWWTFWFGHPTPDSCKEWSSRIRRWGRQPVPLSMTRNSSGFSVRPFCTSHKVCTSVSTVRPTGGKCTVELKSCKGQPIFCLIQKSVIVYNKTGLYRRFCSSFHPPCRHSCSSRYIPGKWLCIWMPFCIRTIPSDRNLFVLRENSSK